MAVGGAKHQPPKKNSAPSFETCLLLLGNSGWSSTSEKFRLHALVEADGHVFWVAAALSSERFRLHAPAEADGHVF